jgi:hopanoid biosynthesis associated radical SAM protein HpnH
VPSIQQFKIARYILTRTVQRKKRYPLVLMLEPLLRCNLSCPGCGKINHPEEILAKRLSTDECVQAALECGAPVVSIAGGEPLLHRDMPRIVSRIMGLGKFVYLCTNAVLLRKQIHNYEPSPYFTFTIHLDGNRAWHDRAVAKAGVFDLAVGAIESARAQGFRVNINCTLYDGMTAAETADFFDFVMDLGIEGITVTPGFMYERASKKDAFMNRMASKQLFREIFRLGKERAWRFNHTSLYLDFLAGNQSYQCTPWGNPTRNIFGWQRPCYLLMEGFAPSFRALMEETEWDRYGPGRFPKCDDCMLHSGFEATAVNDTFSHPLKALRRSVSGLRTDGPMAPDPVGAGYPGIRAEKQDRYESIGIQLGQDPS